ncbi:uncharacterized protein LOC129759143 [Uranotaenia lowii]|uniref:uncharacterized protein LOC129759143 n=1 Tax=Uranotaenia lowii TaxID=190385 RepID=UPI002479C57E|nr:uncharacterized protein LOC129759143 [Uranotaenia lowii]
MMRTPPSSADGDQRQEQYVDNAVMPKQQNVVKSESKELKVMKFKMEAMKRNLLRVEDGLLDEDVVPNMNLQSKQFLQLQVRIVEAAHTEAEALRMRLFELDAEEEIREEYEADYIEIEHLYGKLFVFLTTRMDDIERKEKEQIYPPAVSNPPFSTAQYHVPPLKVPLPTFDGKYENWYAFKSMFQTVMSRYRSESPAIKLYHLRNSLVDKAAGIIDQDIINNNDYDAAWMILQNRFEDRRLIIDKHIDALLDLPKLNSESATDLRKLIDVCTKNVDALRNLGLNVTGLGESMLLNRIASRLDSETRKAWELSQKIDELPDYAETMEFLRERCRVLEKINLLSSVKPAQRMQKPIRVVGDPKMRINSFVTRTEQCPHCQGSHELWKCDAFKKVSLSDRYTTLRKAGACFNCLQKGHRTTNCSSESTCKKCKKRHHTILHPEINNQQKRSETPATSTKFPEPNQHTSEAAPAAQVIPESETRSSFCVQPKVGGKQILLSTAVVLVCGNAGEPYPCRVLLDSGSHTNFVTESFATLLALEKEPVHFSISGLNDIKTKVRFKIHTMIKSRISEYHSCLDFLVVPRITGLLPLTMIDPVPLSIPDGIQLADPNFYVPEKVDMLLGAEVFFQMLKTDRLHLSSSAVLQDTQFGWVLSGAIPKKCSGVVQSFCNTVEDENLDALVKRFWQIDSFSDPEPAKEPEEELCVQHYLDNYQRAPDGRYVVRLPFNGLQHKLGDSRVMAEKRFQSVERRLDASPDIKQQYSEFLREYEDLGHMKQNTNTDQDNQHAAYYLPHHYVLKPSSTTTRLRVVFDGSAESSSGISINKTQMVGPTVQSHLVQILLNFRSYKFVFTLDIPKMYRQVLVHQDDIPYQRIVWRETRNQPLRTYDLQTVTYGLASSPFLATMTLNQLAEDEGHRYPLAAEVLKNSFYIDDALTGANTLAETIELKNQLVALLARGGFEAHKFCANSDLILTDVPNENCEVSINTDPSINTIMKTLGVSWKPKEDCFTFVVPQNVHLKITQRRRQDF